MKKVIAMILSLVMLCSVAFSNGFAVSAASYDEEILSELSVNNLPNIVDDADLLTESQISTIELLLNNISDSYQFDVVIHTVTNTNGKTSQEYADDYYDYNGYGYGANADGVLLLVNMNDREWHVTTTGFGISAITETGLDYMSDKFVPYLSDGGYYEAFLHFADLSEIFVKQAKTGTPYDGAFMPDDSNLDGFEYVFVDGEAEITRYTGNATNVTIPLTIDGHLVTSIGKQAFLYRVGIVSVHIPSSVTYIGVEAFNSCYGLGSVSIPESVTHIDDRAFYHCEELTLITISKNIKKIGEQAFGGCVNLSEINVDEANNYFKSVDGVLFNKLMTTLIQYPSKKTSNIYEIPNSVKNIAELAFYKCTNLVSITISNSVTAIESSTFSHCNSITMVVMPMSIEIISNNAFSYCTNLTNVLYSGTEEQWDEIEINSNNECLNGANVYYSIILDSQSEWGKSYIDFIVNDIECLSQNASYELIYIDADAIPELWIDYNINASGCKLVWFNQGDVSIRHFGMGSLEYIEKKNLMNHNYGVQGSYSDTICTISQKDLEVIAIGTYVTGVTESGSQDWNNFIYRWDGVEVTEEEYLAAVDSYINSEEKKITGNIDCEYNIGEILSYLSQVSKSDDSNILDNEFSEWKNLYIDYIENELLSGYCLYDRYDIVYLDDDNIPEIMLFSSSAIPGNAMLWISDGKVNVMDNFGYGECLYIEREGVTRISYINHGNYAYGIYLLEQGEFKELHRGICWNKWDSDFSGTKKGTFEWDGESVSQEEFNNKLEQAFDVSKATKATYNQPITDLPDAIKQFVQDNVDTENTSKSFATYFVDFLEPYYDKMINVDMPCQTIIANGGVEAVYWNAFLLSLKSLPDFKLGVDEKSFYEAILFDLITDTVSSVDYEKEMKKQTMDMVNMLVDFLIDKGVDVSKENCSKADLDDMYTALSDYWFAKDIQMTKEVYDAFADGCNNAEDCIEKISVYAVAMQQSQNLVEALKLMSKESEKDSNAKTLKSALDEMVDLMNMEPLECVNYVLDEKVIEMGTDAAVSVICNFALDTIKEVFPIDKVLDCIKVADWGSNLIYPTSLSSEQQYRIYALYHVEDIARQSFATAWSNYQNNKTEENANIVTSCYDMFVRIYEHEIIECEALAELIYKKGILNGIKNYFSSNSMDDYYFAVDWVKSYNANLEIMKNCKYNAYLSWGIAYDKLEPVIYISVIDGKVVNYAVEGVSVGETVTLPEYEKYNSFTGKHFLLKNLIGEFEGWYYDEDCTSPCFANNAVANEPIVRYAKFSSRSGKKIQVKCPVNVEVYDSDNVLCLKIEDNKTVVDNGSLSVVITDSCKEIFVPDGQYYTVNLTAFDDGVMNYSVTEINNSIATKRFNFYDVSLYDGQVYNGQVEPENYLPKESYALTTLSDNGETIVETADEELYQNEMQTLDIAVMVEGNGCASNGALVTKGDYVKLSATPDEAESFLGWYSNDNIISSECDFSFIAKEGMNIVAKFTADGQSSSGTETTDPTEPVVIGLLGDATEDGKVNIKDATLIQKSIANLTTLTETGEALADADLNTKINIKDATAIQKHIAGIETGYPISKPKTK